MKRTEAHDARVALKQKRRFRSRWLTFVRMCRYGVNNFSRNAWLSVAATAVMVITLMVVFSALTARSVLLDTVDTLRNRVDISIYLKSDITEEEVDGLREELADVENVNEVEYIDAERAKQIYAEQNRVDPEHLEIIAELPDNPFPASLRVTVFDLNDMEELENTVNESEPFQNALHPDPRREPTFAGERREVLDNIGNWVSFADRVGLIASGVFIIISIMIIFNTIRMAIFNRREEIEIMKLIGADRGFIRGPFLVEGVMYGFFAALVAFALGVTGLLALQGPLTGYGIEMQGVIDFMTRYWIVVLLGLIVLGALVGVISSMFAVRRYLKV